MNNPFHYDESDTDESLEYGIFEDIRETILTESSRMTFFQKLGAASLTILVVTSLLEMAYASPLGYRSIVVVALVSLMTWINLEDLKW